MNGLKRILLIALVVLVLVAAAYAFIRDSSSYSAAPGVDGRVCQ